MTQQKLTPTAQSIQNKLRVLAPTHIELINESMHHAGYFEGKESHFKLTIVSAEFVGKRLIARHQLVYGLLNELMIAQGGTIHALALHTFTPDEWQEKQQSPDSPKCAGANNT